jgi:hypothetical protein
MCLIQEGSTWIIHKIQVFPSRLNFLTLVVSHPPHTVATKSISRTTTRLSPILHTLSTQNHLSAPNSVQREITLALSTEPSQGSTSHPMWRNLAPWGSLPILYLNPPHKT